MITREQYLTDSRNLHNAYYLEIADACGLPAWTDGQIAKFRTALEIGEHMNSIPLAHWDQWAEMLLGKYGCCRRACLDALKARGDLYSLAGSVCILKAHARRAARQEG